MDYYYDQLRFAIGGRPTFLVLGSESDTCHVSNQTISTACQTASRLFLTFGKNNPKVVVQILILCS